MTSNFGNIRITQPKRASFNSENGRHSLGFPFTFLTSSINDIRYFFMEDTFLDSKRFVGVAEGVLWYDALVRLLFGKFYPYDNDRHRQQCSHFGQKHWST